METKKLLLLMPKYETAKPIVYELIKKYNLIVNIFRARITPDEQGHMVIDVTGEENDIYEAIKHLHDQEITVNEKNEGMIWNEDKCVGCGNCNTHCPTDALHITDSKTMKQAFDKTLCIECLNCIQICPFGACTSIF